MADSNTLILGELMSLNKTIGGFDARIDSVMERSREMGSEIQKLESEHADMKAAIARLTGLIEQSKVEVNVNADTNIDGNVAGHVGEGNSGAVG